MWSEAAPGLRLRVSDSYGSLGSCFATRLFHFLRFSAFA